MNTRTLINHQTGKYTFSNIPGCSVKPVSGSGGYLSVPHTGGPGLIYGQSMYFCGANSGTAKIFCVGSSVFIHTTRYKNLRNLNVIKSNTSLFHLWVLLFIISSTLV